MEGVVCVAAAWGCHWGLGTHVVPQRVPRAEQRRAEQATCGRAPPGARAARGLPRRRAHRTAPPSPCCQQAMSGMKAGKGGIIANPNCSTIIALMAVTPLHRLGESWAGGPVGRGTCWREGCQCWRAALEALGGAGSGQRSRSTCCRCALRCADPEAGTFAGSVAPAPAPALPCNTAPWCHAFSCPHYLLPRKLAPPHTIQHTHAHTHTCARGLLHPKPTPPPTRSQGEAHGGVYLPGCLRRRPGRHGGAGAADPGGAGG